jgi:predicted DNA binding CopG/RHH family protein
MKFDDYELELLNAVEAAAHFERVKDYEDELMMAQVAAKNYLNKTKNINVRLPEYDIIQLKRKSAELSIPYQTILTSLIHQYVTGRIKPAM